MLSKNPIGRVTLTATIGLVQSGKWRESVKHRNAICRRGSKETGYFFIETAKGANLVPRIARQQ